MGKNTTAAALATPAAQTSNTPSPDNTPVPGGGRWAWDISLPGWVNLDAPADADADTSAIAGTAKTKE